MDTIKNQLINQYLLKIKRIVNEDAYGEKFIIRPSKKNITFMHENKLTRKDIKEIIKKLSIQDYLSRAGRR